MNSHYAETSLSRWQNKLCMCFFLFITRTQRWKDEKQTEEWESCMTVSNSASLCESRYTFHTLSTGKLSSSCKAHDYFITSGTLSSENSHAPHIKRSHVFSPFDVWRVRCLVPAFDFVKYSWLCDIMFPSFFCLWTLPLWELWEDDPVSDFPFSCLFHFIRY